MRVGFIGLGSLGYPLAARIAHSFPIVTWNRTHEVAERHRHQHGTSVSRSLHNLAAASDVVVTCLPTSREVGQVGQAMRSHLKHGTRWLDATSGDPRASRVLADSLADIGVTFIDCPVSGGVRAARRGELTAIAGGTAESLATVRPLIDAFASQLFHVGPVGSGHAVKAVNNLLGASSLWAVLEGLAGLHRMGVDPTVALQAINESSGASHSSKAHAPRILDGAREAPFRLELMVKDIATATGVIGSDAVESLANCTLRAFELAARRLPDGSDYYAISEFIASPSRGQDQPSSNS